MNLPTFILYVIVLVVYLKWCNATYRYLEADQRIVYPAWVAALIITFCPVWIVIGICMILIQNMIAATKKKVKR